MFILFFHFELDCMDTPIMDAKDSWVNSFDFRKFAIFFDCSHNEILLNRYLC